MEQSKDNIRILTGLLMNWKTYSSLMDDTHPSKAGTKMGDVKTIVLPGLYVKYWFFSPRFIQDAINALDEPKKTFILRHYRDGISQSEIARTHNPSVTQALVQWHIAEGLKKIIATIKGYVEELEHKHFSKELDRLGYEIEGTPTLDTLHEWIIDIRKKNKVSA